MLETITRELYADAGLAADPQPLTDADLWRLCGAVGLHISYTDIRPPYIGALARGTLYLPADLEPEPRRVLLAYGVARSVLYGPDDCTTMAHPPLYYNQTKDRAFLLSGRIVLGPDYAPATTTEELAEVAELAGVPLWFVAVYQRLQAADDARLDLWTFPALGRRVRRLARAKGLALA